MESAIRQQFRNQLDQVEQTLLEMVAVAETMVHHSVQSLVNQDEDLAQKVMVLDDDVDKRELALETMCVKLLALQQPMASDLREVGTVLKIITDIERVGDLSVDIAKAGMKIQAEMGRVDYVDYGDMSRHAREMIRIATEAFVKRDTKDLARVVELEERVDALYRFNRNNVHALMRENPSEVVAASWHILALHHIERVADHALNIAERVYYMVTGEMKVLAKTHSSDNPEQ